MHGGGGLEEECLMVDLTGEDTACRSKWIVGVDQVTTRLFGCILIGNILLHLCGLRLYDLG